MKFFLGSSSLLFSSQIQSKNPSSTYMSILFAGYHAVNW